MAQTEMERIVILRQAYQAACDKFEKRPSAKTLEALRLAREKFFLLMRGGVVCRKN